MAFIRYIKYICIYIFCISVKNKVSPLKRCPLSTCPRKSILNRFTQRWALIYIYKDAKTSVLCVMLYSSILDPILRCRGYVLCEFIFTFYQQQAYIIMFEFQTIAIGIQKFKTHIVYNHHTSSGRGQKVNTDYIY